MGAVCGTARPFPRALLEGLGSPAAGFDDDESIFVIPVEYYELFWKQSSVGGCYVGQS